MYTHENQHIWKKYTCIHIYYIYINAYTYIYICIYINTIHVVYMKPGRSRSCLLYRKTHTGASTNV